MKHVSLLILRLVVGGLLAGHGAQKLFGWFGGRGLEGTEAMVGSMGLRPTRPWAMSAGLSEFGGGMLTALGLLNPIGPLLAIGAMVMASVKVHLGRPIWNAEGGAELPVINIAAMTAVALAGPGALSADRLLGIRLPRRLAIPGLVLIAAAVGAAVDAEERADGDVTPEPEETRAGLELQAGGSTESTTIEPDPASQPTPA